MSNRNKKAVVTTVRSGKHKGQFKFTLFAGNGEAVAQSYPETYTSRQMCEKTLKRDFPDFQIVPKFAVG